MSEHSVEKIIACQKGKVWLPFFVTETFKLHLKGESQMAVLFVFFGMALLIAWAAIDLVFGMKKQKQQTKKETKRRYSSLKLFCEGGQFFEHFFADIEQATHHLHIQFFIVKDDDIGKKLVGRLIDKSKQGVEVRLLIDFIGCKLKRKSLKKLKEAGVIVAKSYVPKWPRFFFTLNRRNHRKVAVIDGKVGYLGGFNVGDEYLGRDINIGYWRDYHLRIEGDGVQDLQAQFLSDWQEATKTKLHSDVYFPPLQKGNSPVEILPTNGMFLEESWLGLISQAKSTLYIATPYFIPGEKLHREIIAAARRGVKVKLLVPKLANHILVKEAGYPYFQELLKENVLIYLYYRGFFHGKIIAVDGQICDIGTANFDKRSLHMNHEINCLIYDEAFIKHVLQQLNNDIAISELLTLESYENRSLFFKTKEKIATTLSPFL